ncbi:bifunctional heptose 7-phosphate kinase/heptose 1-phosphate adenyltransferase [uncultured Microscilla sp.]|uniref:bifunctional heptose 7-phosphate kinase/heptose 1-phosphate adenyltransferase n=1 Tax=uncultured Microscilla sp. TaxID=432653 RepID=UPI002602DCEB|nr:bifunctional ADP-heptose synthase [uncultured Microscilla sp.]
MQYDSIEAIFNAFSQQRILIIGDVMVDSYLWGKVERISPEAPVPIVQVQQREKRLGGAANVAMNIQALGAEPVLCSVIGNDGSGTDLLNLLDAHQLPKEGMLQSKERITTIKHRILSGHQHILRVDHEHTTNLTPTETHNLLALVKKLADSCHAIIFEDYDKGVLGEELIQGVIEYANAKGIPTIVDPKKKNFLNYTGATLFKPNLKELKDGLKIEFNAKDANELKDAVAKLKQTLQVKQALVTLSELGVYMDNGKDKVHIPAHLRSIADVSGAGDTLVSVAALCLALNTSPRFTAALSNLAGGLVCEHLGVVSIDKQLLLNEAIKHNILQP